MASRRSGGILGGLLIVIALLFGIYSAVWFQVAEEAKVSYVRELSKLGNEADVAPPEVSGYPGKLVLRKDKEVITSDTGSLEILDLKASSWPFPNQIIEINTGALTLKSTRWVEGLSFDSFHALMRANQDIVIFEDSALKQRDFEAQVTGSVDISDRNVAIPDLLVSLSNHEDFLTVLVDSGIIEEQVAKFVGFGMSAFTNDDTQKVEVPVYAKNGMINLGPLPILKLPEDEKPLQRQKPVIPQAAP